VTLLQHSSDGDDDPLYALDDSFMDDLPKLLQAFTPPATFKHAATDNPFVGLKPNDQPPMR